MLCVEDGEEDAVLYSDVKINKESCERKSDGTDPFIDSSIRKWICVVVNIFVVSVCLS